VILNIFSFPSVERPPVPDGDSSDPRLSSPSAGLCFLREIVYMQSACLNAE
jgi:hypothetical protein